MSGEPIGAEAIKAAIVYILSVLVTVIGLPISTDQQTVIIGGAPFIALAWVWWKGRQKVVPVVIANAQIAKVAKQQATNNTDTIKALQFKEGK